MADPTPENTVTVHRDELLAWAAAELMRPPGDEAAGAMTAADVAGMMLATAAAHGDEGRVPDHVAAAVPLAETVRLLHAALRVGGSIIRQVPDAEQFVRELIARLRDER